MSSENEEPIRRIDDPFERMLLNAASDDSPPEGAIGRALKELGARAAVAAAAVGSAAVLGSGAAGSAASTAGAAPSIAPAGKLATLAAWKWIVIGAIIASSATAFVIFRSRSHQPAPMQPMTTATHLLASRASVNVVPTIRVEELEPAPPDPEPEATAPKPGSKQLVTRSSASDVTPRTTAPAPVSMAAEIALIDRARRALTRGSPDEALGLLDQYQRDFSSGTLSNEARVLRIEALAKRGDRARAKQLATEFMQSNPDDVHRERVEKLDRSLSKP